jgi:hypothetical protein
MIFFSLFFVVANGGKSIFFHIIFNLSLSHIIYTYD